MSRFLVDTNVVSEFIKPQPDSGVVNWLDAADPNSLFVSVVTFGEIRLGIEDLPAGRRRAALEELVPTRIAWLVRIATSAGDQSHRRPLGAAHHRSQEEGHCNRHC